MADMPVKAKKGKIPVGLAKWHASHHTHKGTSAAVKAKVNLLAQINSLKSSNKK
jgi:hypothetical protein